MQLYEKIMESYYAFVQYVADHPIVLGVLLLFLFLAIVGAWYVLSHHLHVLLVTLLCAGGFAAGALVLYRGITLEMNDLIAVGGFLVVIFPLIYREAVRVAAIAYGGGGDAVAKGHAKRAGM
jgi:hypothetical protein